MAAKGNLSAPAGNLRPTCTYRTMKNIIYDLSPVKNGTFIGDSIEKTAVDRNNLRSALWRWTNMNPLQNGSTEKDERAQAYRKWL